MFVTPLFTPRSYRVFGAGASARTPLLRRRFGAVAVAVPRGGGGSRSFCSGFTCTPLSEGQEGTWVFCLVANHPSDAADRTGIDAPKKQHQLLSR